MTVHGAPWRDVEVVAHRGASADQPEHTLAAYRHAVRVESALATLRASVCSTVDAVITDHPDALLRRLGRGPAVPREGSG